MSAQLKSVPPVTLRDSTQKPRADSIGAVARGVSSVALNRLVRAHRSRIFIGVGVVIVAIAAIVASQLLAHKHSLAPPAPVQTISVGPVARGPMQRSLVVNGSLAAWDELPVGAEAGGLAITQVAVEEGDGEMTFEDEADA